MFEDRSAHAKSVSPTKEIVWRRRSPSQSARALPRPFTCFAGDDAESVANQRQSFQTHRQHSTNFHDFYGQPLFESQFSRGNCTAANQPPPAPCSFYDVPRNRHSALELSMHSSDSLNSDRRIPTMSNSEQFQQFGTSPPRTTMPTMPPEFQHVPGPQMSSPIMARRELSNPPQMAQHQPMPYQPQMLVDPNTGQHYIFPAPQPQYFYPVIPTPVYYQPAAGGYIVASQPQPMPQPPQSPTHARAAFFKPQQPQFNGYFVEHPPSSNVSVCGAPEGDYFSRSHASRQSLESGSSGRTESERTRKNSRDSMSPAPQPMPQTSFARLPANSEAIQPGKFSTTSSCTSGFASGNGDGAVDNNGINTSFTANKTRPAWWGQQEASTRIGMEEKQSPTHRPLLEKRSSPTDEKETEKTPTHAETGKTSPKPVQKAIRMDIDLSAPINQESPEKKPQPSRPSVATAFTVTFDPEPNKPFSLQEAARQAPRRLTRRSAPVKPTTDSEGEQQDPKHYLFNKMIQGLNKTPSCDLEAISDKEFDTLSEAGTYVVDSRSKMEESQVLASGEDSSSDETDSTVSKPSTSAKPAADPAVETSTKSLLAQRLEELRKRTNAPVSLKQPSSTERKDLPPSRLCQRSSNPPAVNSNFRRGDGGRFSMRTTSAAAFNPPKTAPKPPFKAGAAPAAVKKSLPVLPPVKDTPEMVAWLRRKEYDPRKSAAEAKKIQQLKARESIFQQNRSLSFHPGSDSNIQKLRQEQHKSHDDLSHVGEDDEFQPNLEKQVDALTQKCLKSIQLIKLCNQNTLSESVENLLDRVVVPEEDEPQAEPISDQLQRLSSAFDAIQKYFEEQRSSSASPPVFRRLTSRDGQSPRKLQVPKTSSGSRHIKLDDDETF